MAKFGLLIALVLILSFFSLLSIGELWALKWLGFDLIAHMRATYDSGHGYQFYFEAFGVAVFIIAQPIIFKWLLVWAFSKLQPTIAAHLSTQFLNTIMK